jgi:hypothetical protein
LLILHRIHDFIWVMMKFRWEYAPIIGWSEAACQGGKW